ncbi:MAG: DNA polymerase III subunit delta [Pseudomonadota bacterium]
MQIKVEQLSQRLKQQASPLIWISGDETLLVQETCDQVRAFAREQGYTEREVIDAGAGYDWNQLLLSNNSLSLFAERKLLDLRPAKFDEPCRTALAAYLENPNPDNLLLLTTGKIEKAAQSSKWFAALEAKALFCQLWPINEQELPRWIEQRLQKHGVTIEREALQLLSDRVEGNLLAAAQEVEKLRLHATDNKITAERVMEVVADNSRFTVFTLTDACLGGNTERALKILEHLQAEGDEPLALLGMLCRELRGLSAMLADIAQGRSVRDVVQANRVWGNRVQLTERALQIHNQRSVLALLERARIVDQTVKGLLNRKAWDELASLVLNFSNPRLLVGMI